MSLRWKTILLMTAVFTAYFLTRSLWLDEWDSVQFALALDEFNLWKHQPHPPGYPMYVFSGYLLHAVGLDPITALVLVGCLAGAVFIGLWFRIVAEAFSESLAWLVAAATALTPAVWLTATKALTDVPAAAALTFAVWLALRYVRTPTLRGLVQTALAGALATGFRPQWFAVVLVLLITAVLRARGRGRDWAIMVVALLAGNLLWLVPTSLSQADAEPQRAGHLAYPRQLMRQWQWRLDKPNVYIGAGDMSAGRIKARLVEHVEGWTRKGLGLRSEGKRALFYFLFLAGVALTIYRRSTPGFWLLQGPWAILLALVVFCCLPEDRRYYVPLAPLMWLGMLAGLHSLGRRWAWAGWLVPLRLAGLCLPIAWAGHLTPPAPVQAIEAVRARHPATETGTVLLMVGESKRHADWYARDMEVRRAKANEASSRTVRKAMAIYTDRPDFPLEAAFAGCRLEPVGTFKRSQFIYTKHNEVALFRIWRPEEVPTVGK